jgi:hypothetical protein
MGGRGISRCRRPVIRCSDPGVLLAVCSPVKTGEHSRFRLEEMISQFVAGVYCEIRFWCFSPRNGFRADFSESQDFNVSVGRSSVEAPDWAELPRRVREFNGRLRNHSSSPGRAVSDGPFRAELPQSDGISSANPVNQACRHRETSDIPDSSGSLTACFAIASIMNR